MWNLILQEYHKLNKKKVQNKNNLIKNIKISNT